MGILYLAALIIGFGTIALQLAMGGESDADADADADVHLDAELDADADADAGHADAGHAHADHGHADGGFLPIFLSLRFWTFTFLAFGLSGSLIHYLDLANSAVALVIAIALGLGAGLLASLTFRALSRSEANSGATDRDAVGTVGKVLLPLAKGARGKIRIQLKGQTVDFVATTDDEQIESGQLVMIEEMRETTAHVSRAPVELLPPKREP